MNARQEERSEARHDHLIAILLRARVQSARALAHPVVHRRNKIGFSYEPRACLPMVVHHPAKLGASAKTSPELLDAAAMHSRAAIVALRMKAEKAYKLHSDAARGLCDRAAAERIKGGGRGFGADGSPISHPL